MSGLDPLVLLQDCRLFSLFFQQPPPPPHKALDFKTTTAPLFLFFCAGKTLHFSNLPPLVGSPARDLKAFRDQSVSLV